MDDLRGQFGVSMHEADYGLADDDLSSEPPPSPVGQDERRMQVRAYNHWASLLGDGPLPSIEDLDPRDLPDFGPYSVLLDFTNGIDNPAIRFLGEILSQECDVPASVGQLDDVPARSLLSRITDHYMQILANQAPIGFEAEFVNQRGATIMYRGILLPYSSDLDTIDFIYGVINWKEIADQLTSDELLLEIDQALDNQEDKPRMPTTVTDWADGPHAGDPAAQTTPDAAAPLSDDPFPLPAFGGDDNAELAEEEEDEPLDLYEVIEAVDEEPEGPSRFASLLTLGGGSANRDAFGGSFEDGDEEDYGNEDEDPVAKWLKRPTPLDALPETGGGSLPEPSFGRHAPIDLSSFDNDTVEPIFSEAAALDLDQTVEGATEPLAPTGLGTTEYQAPAPAADSSAALDTLAYDTEAGLYDCLAAARESALAALSCEDRSRSALYAAVGRAYDFSLAALAEPEAFAELVADSGLTVQERAPMTPVVKLVFGADYDKTRIAEYASVLSHAHRVGIERGTLAEYLGRAEGGLKGVVQAEREARKGNDNAVRETPREALARKLRAIAPLGFEDIANEGEEFALVMIRRVDGEVVVLGEVADVALVEKAAKKLVA